MPIYEFKCKECSVVIEKLMLYKDISDDMRCEKCGGGLVRVYSVPSLKFVGPDFYVNEEKSRKEKTRIAGDVAAAHRKIAEDKYRETNARTEKKSSTKA